MLDHRIAVSVVGSRSFGILTTARSLHDRWKFKFEAGHGLGFWARADSTCYNTVEYMRKPGLMFVTNVSCMCNDDHYLVAVETVRPGISVYLQNTRWFLKTGVASSSRVKPQHFLRSCFDCGGFYRLFKCHLDYPTGAICQSHWYTSLLFCFVLFFLLYILRDAIPDRQKAYWVKN